MPQIAQSSPERPPATGRHQARGHGLGVLVLLGLLGLLGLLDLQVPRAPFGARDAAAQNPFLQNRSERTVESITFVGNDRVKTYVLARELGFEEGDPYDPEKITEAWERIEALDFIAYAEIETQRRPGHVALVIKVEEDTRFNWAPGLEYSRRYGKTWLPRVRLGLSDISGRGETLDLHLEAWKHREARVVLANPWILGDAHLGVYASAGVEQNDWLYFPFNGQDVRDWGGELGLWRAFDPWVTARLAAGWREVQLLEGDGDVPAGTVQDPFLRLSLVHDSRDARYYPRQGVHLVAETRLAGFSDDFEDGYALTDLSASAFAALPWVHTLGGHLGYRTASDPLPFYERSWLGGPMNLRGVEFGSIRGDESFVASLELRRPVAVLPLREGRSIGLGAHLFHDWGKAWETDESFDDREIRFSWGAGLHFNLNTQNFRFEWARNDEGEDVFVFEDSFTF